jgi:cyclophilin family peptidyl-prolyl cis-trans isomerase/HEAT repeat protein
VAALGCRAPLGRALDDDRLADRARLLRIEDTRRDEPAFLDSMLVSSSPIRAAAALTVGRLGGSLHRSAVRSLATSPDPHVAATALFALAMLKDTASVAIASRALRQPAPVAVQGAWLLGELGEAARTSVVSALGDPRPDAQTRGALLLAAARLRPLPAGAVIPWVASPDSGVAWRAAYAIARGRSAAGVRSLLTASMSPWAALREQVARGLTHAMAGDSLGMSAVQALHRLAGDVDPHVRINAVRALATYRVQERALVIEALRDADAGVRLTAAQSLEQVLDSSAAAWSNAFDADTAFVVQRTVAEVAARRGLGTVHVGSWRTSPEWQRRATYAEIDAIGPAAHALTRVEPWTHDGDGRVRAAATSAVARLADSASARVEARTMLRGALRDPDVEVRAAALGALASGATSADLGLALDSYRLFSGDGEGDARLAFWHLADSATRRGDALSTVVRDKLSALAKPTDPLERGAAAVIPEFAAWRDDSGVPRALSWYVARVRESLAPTRHATVDTERGSVVLRLFGSDAPLTVYNFVTLARAGFYDGLRFHRVVPDFVAQGGDPRGDGNGGPGYAIRDEINPNRYLRGTLGMALSGPHTGGSQFFITLSPQPHLDGGYTVFGQLVAGSDVLDRIVQGDRIVRVTIQ